MREALRRRAAWREQPIARAREYHRRLARRIGPCPACVVGSVARGDFHEGSDVDVVVVSAHLPRDPLARLELLYRDVLPGVEPKGFTPEEWERERARGNPLVLEALAAGVPLHPVPPDPPGVPGASP